MQIQVSPASLRASTMVLNTTLLVLPDLKGVCPWPVLTNPHFDEICKYHSSILYSQTHSPKLVASKSSAWADSFGFFSGSKRQHFIRSATELLASYTYPYAGPEELRVCSDAMNLFWVIDEILDDMTYPEVCDTAKSYMKAMKGELNDGSAFAHMATEYVSSV